MSISLTDKQRRFVEEYCKDFNAAAAARRAGYSKKTAGQIGHENLQKEYIAEAIKARIEEVKQSRTLLVDADVFEGLLQLYGDVETMATEVSRVLRSLLSDVEKPDSLLSRNSIKGASRYEVLYRAGFKCQACGAKPTRTNDVSLQIDHIVPHSCGGSDDLENLQVLCEACNLSKGNRYAYNHNRDERS